MAAEEGANPLQLLPQLGFVLRSDVADLVAKLSEDFPIHFDCLRLKEWNPLLKECLSLFGLHFQTRQGHSCISLSKKQGVMKDDSLR
jgi:hypothetical protein